MILPTWINETSNGRIYQGDAAEVLASQPDGSAALVVTSPPYCDSWGDGTPGPYVEWLTAELHPLRRVLHPDGLLWLVIGGAMVPGMVTEAFRASGWVLVHRALWSVESRLAPVRVDTVLVFATSMGCSAAPMDWPGLSAPEVRPQVQTEDGQWFPSFPREIPRVALSNCSVPGYVADPFMGHGTTLLEAQAKKGRAFLGVDVSARMCDEAAQRLQHAGKDRWAYCCPSPGGFVPCSLRPDRGCKVCLGRGYDGFVTRARPEGRNGSQSHEIRQGYRPCRKCYPGEEVWARPEVKWGKEKP